MIRARAEISRGSIAVLIGLAWALSSNRKLFPWKLVLGGVLLQGVLRQVARSAQNR